MLSPNAYPPNYGHEDVQNQADQEVQKLNQKLSGEAESDVKPEPVVPTTSVNYAGRSVLEEIEEQYPLKVSGSLPETSRDKISIVVRKRRNIGKD